MLLFQKSKTNLVFKSFSQTNRILPFFCEVLNFMHTGANAKKAKVPNRKKNFFGFFHMTANVLPCLPISIAVNAKDNKIKSRIPEIQDQAFKTFKSKKSLYLSVSQICNFVASSHLKKKVITNLQNDSVSMTNLALLTKKVQKRYGIIRIDTGFTNFNFSLTTLDGKVRLWISGGCDSIQTKRTRMTSRAVGNLMMTFLKTIKKRKMLASINFLKVLFVGPSKRFRGKLFKQISRKIRYGHRRTRILCRVEAFRRSFNGCRLTRKKR